MGLNMSFHYPPPISISEFSITKSEGDDYLCSGIINFSNEYCVIFGVMDISTKSSATGNSTDGYTLSVPIPVKAQAICVFATDLLPGSSPIVSREPPPHISYMPDLSSTSQITFGSQVEIGLTSWIGIFKKVQ